MTRVRSLFGAALLTVMATLAPTSAYAFVDSPYTIHDGQGDASIAKGDIAALTIAVRPARLQFTIRVAQGHDVRSTPAWQHPQSRNKIDIRIDAVGDAHTDYRLIANSAGVNLWSVPDGSLVCEAEGVQPALNRIVLWVPRSCVDNTTGVRAWAEMVWDRAPYGNRDSTDRAPNSGQSQLVVGP